MSVNKYSSLLESVYEMSIANTMGCVCLSELSRVVNRDYFIFITVQRKYISVISSCRRICTKKVWRI